MLLPLPTQGRLRAMCSLPKPCQRLANPAQTTVPKTAKLQDSNKPSPCHSHTARARCPRFDVQLDSQQNWLQVSPVLTASPQEEKAPAPTASVGRDGSLSLQREGKQLGSAQKKQTLISAEPSSLPRGKVMLSNGNEPVPVAF